MTGLIAGLYWHPPAEIILWAALSFLISGLYFVIRNHEKLSKVVLSLGIFLAGNLLINHQVRPELPFHHIYYWAHNQPLTVEGSLYRPVEYLPNTTRLYVNAQWVWAQGKRYPVTGNILLTAEDGREKFLLDDRIVFSARLRKPRNFGNPGSFNYKRWLAFQDIYVTGYLPKDQTLFRIGVKNHTFSLRNIDRFRDQIRKALDSHIPSPANLLLRALLLGERKVIPEEIGESFVRTGTAHILAISGLHIGIVAAVAYFLLRRLLSLSQFLLLLGNVPKLAAFLSLFPISFYALMAGAGVSVQRAFIMIAAYIIALLFNRERNLCHALALAALVILTIQPSSLFGASFQLSFISVWGIVFFSPRLLSLLPAKDELLQKIETPRWKNIKHKVIIFIAVSFSAMLATGPLVAYHFNLFSLSGLISNLIIVPLAGTFVVPLGLLGVVFTPFFFPLAKLLFHTAGFLSDLVIMVATFFAHIPWTNYLVPTPALSEMILFYFFLTSLFLWKFSALPRKLLFLSFLLFIITPLYWHFHFQPRGFQVTFIDVGQGDAALLRFPKGEAMLIDGGGFPNHRFDTGKNIVAPFLLRQRVCKVDYLVLSHPHPDHYDGLGYIAKNFSVREFWYNGDSIDDPYFEDLLTTLKQRGVLIRTINSNSPSKAIQGVRVDVLHPDPLRYLRNHDVSANLNNRSLVLKFSYGDVQYLFAGDIYSSTEERLVSGGKNLSARVLKIPHHGSSTSGNPNFIKAVGPRIGICSVGYHNPFHLPHPRIINLYRKEGCTVYRTDSNGAIITITDGKTVDITCGGRGDF